MPMVSNQKDRDSRLVTSIPRSDLLREYWRQFRDQLKRIRPDDAEKRVDNAISEFNKLLSDTVRSAQHQIKLDEIAQIEPLNDYANVDSVTPRTQQAVWDKLRELDSGTLWMLRAVEAMPLQESVSVAPEENLPERIRPSSEFNLCREGAKAFHRASSDAVEGLIMQKYNDFVRLGLSYPRLFANAKADNSGSQELLRQITQQLHITSSDYRKGEIMADYMTDHYAIACAVLAHLDIRSTLRDVRYRDELQNMSDQYIQRLRKLYDEISFRRSDVLYFLNRYRLIILCNAPESDAVEYIEATLTDSMWGQLNDYYGIFDKEAMLAENLANDKTRIFNKASQRKNPIKRLRWRAPKNTGS
jgi:hypothetical protein